MNGDDATVALIQLLEEIGIEYMLVGSYSSNYYGIPRSTQDADFVVFMRGDELNELKGRLPDGFVLDPQMSFETVTSTTKTLIMVESIAFKIELFDLSGDPFDQSRFSRRVKLNMGGQPVSLPTAEDVIVQKLRWCAGGKREKDYADATDVIATQGSNLDWDYIIGWCEKHGSLNLLEEIRAEIKRLTGG